LNSDNEDSNHWRSKQIIQVNDCIRFGQHLLALKHFSENVDKFLTLLIQSKLKESATLPS